MVSAMALLVITGLVSSQNAQLKKKNEEIEQSRSTILVQRDSLEENRATLADLSLGGVDGCGVRAEKHTGGR